MQPALGFPCEENETVARGRRRPWMQRQRRVGTAQSAESAPWPGGITARAVCGPGGERYSREWVDRTDLGPPAPGNATR